MVNGLVRRVSSEPGALRSMTMSGRPRTSSVSDLMMHRRGSEGSEAEGPLDRPREAFHLARDSSSASA